MQNTSWFKRLPKEELIILYPKSFKELSDTIAMICYFSPKTVIIRMFSLILFLGCASFVTHRGYKCFQKYLENPEAIDVAFKSSGSQIAFFPSITFCSWNEPLKENILKNCNLTSEDYLKKNVWVGQGHANCTNPKVLRDQMIYGLDDLKMEIHYFNIGTYETSYLDSTLIYPNDSRIQWKSIMESSWQTCHTMKLPKTMVELGIRYFVILFKSWHSLYTPWHEDGLLYTDMPDSCDDLLFNGTGYEIAIGHETLDLLDYDGKNCEKSKDYKLDKCRHEFIEEVNSFTKGRFFSESMMHFSHCPKNVPKTILKKIF
jgi:hypothetical protein